MGSKRLWWYSLCGTLALVVAACGGDTGAGQGDGDAEQSDPAADVALEADGETAGTADAEEPADPTQDGGTSEAETNGAGLETARLGLIVPTSGPNAGPGEELLHGVETAVAVWNELGRSPRAELEVCDDAADPERSLTCIDRLTASDVDAFVGPHFGSTWLVAEQAYIDRGVFATSATPAAMPPPDSNAFGAGTPHGPALEMMFGVFEANGVETAGVINTTDASAQAAGAAAEELSAESEVAVVRAEFPNDAATAVPQVQQVVSGGAEAIVFWTTGPSVVTGLRAISEVGFDGPVVMNYSNASPATYELGANVIPEDLRVIASPAFIEGGVEDAERRELTDGFRRIYEEQYGPVSWNAMGGGDTAIVALTAANNGTTAEEMTAYLETGVEVPAFTVTFQYSEDSHVGSDDPDNLRLARLVDGVWELADD